MGTSQSKELHLGNVPWMSVGLLVASTGLVRRGLSWTVRGIKDGNVYCSCVVLSGGAQQCYAQALEILHVSLFSFLRTDLKGKRTRIEKLSRDTGLMNEYCLPFKR